jgi:hypothetical protein
MIFVLPNKASNVVYLKRTALPYPPQLKTRYELIHNQCLSESSSLAAALSSAVEEFI